MEVTVPTNGRTGTAIFRFFEIIEPKHGAPRQSCLACVLGQALAIGRHVVDDPMDPNHFGCFRIGSVGIIDNKDETLSALGYTLPRKRWRDIFALARILGGNMLILLERG